jgi:hypothetical protein
MTNATPKLLRVFTLCVALTAIGASATALGAGSPAAIPTLFIGIASFSACVGDVCSVLSWREIIGPMLLVTFIRIMWRHTPRWAFGVWLVTLLGMLFANIAWLGEPSAATSSAFLPVMAGMGFYFALSSTVITWGFVRRHAAEAAIGMPNPIEELR